MKTKHFCLLFCFNIHSYTHIYVYIINRIHSSGIHLIRQLLKLNASTCALNADLCVTNKCTCDCCSISLCFSSFAYVENMWKCLYISMYIYFSSFWRNATATCNDPTNSNQPTTYRFQNLHALLRLFQYSLNLAGKLCGRPINYCWSF